MHMCNMSCICIWIYSHISINLNHRSFDVFKKLTTNSLACLLMQSVHGTCRWDVWEGAPYVPPIGRTKVNMLGSCICKTDKYGLRLMCITNGHFIHTGPLKGTLSICNICDGRWPQVQYWGRFRQWPNFERRSVWTNENTEMPKVRPLGIHTRGQSSKGVASERA